MKASDVKSAVVLAAGLGTRLRPLTLAQPKPLMPVWGVPMVERVVRTLERWGVERVLVNAHWRAEKIRLWALERNGRAKIEVYDEPEILGTGGALNPMRAALGGGEFWLVNGDIVFEGLDPEEVVRAYEASGRFAGCWMSSDFGPRTIEADDAGHVCNWASDVPGDRGTYTYCGVALLGAKVLDYVKPGGASSIVEAYNAAIGDGLIVRGADPEGAYWADCGNLESYLEAHAALDPDAFDENPNVLFPGVKLLDSADLAGCVATGGLIGGAFERTALVGADQSGDAALCALAEGMGWRAADTALSFMGARGSDREFWLMVRGDDRAVAVKYDDAKRPENARYAHHAKLLAEAGVSVPRILADEPGMKALAIEHISGGSLQEKAAKKGADLVKLYAPVVRELKKMHEEGTCAALERPADAFEPAFGPELFKWEADLFGEYCVKGRYGLEGLPAGVKADLEAAAEALAGEKPVLVHRDFQSSNVLYRGEEPVFIDFQGMRLGPAAYDLASLLYDPYAPLGEKERAELAKIYPVKNLAFGAVRRLVQALGAFGRLESVGKPEFAAHVPKALANLLAAADEADLDALGAFAEDLIALEESRAGRFMAHGHGEDGGE